MAQIARNVTTERRPPAGRSAGGSPAGSREDPAAQRAADRPASGRRSFCLIGPECTGKTTLAARAARELGATCVPEYAREYAERRAGFSPALTAADVEPIARGEIANLDRATGDVIVLDTDLISTVVYARHYYGACPQWIEDEARLRRADRYLLLDTDLTWRPDPARDAGGDAREDLFDAFRAALDEFDTQWEIVSGDFEERWSRIAALVTECL